MRLVWVIGVLVFAALRPAALAFFCSVALLAALSIHTFAADEEMDAIKKVLKKPRVDGSKMPWDEHARDLQPLGDRAIPLLATLLEDYEMGFEVAETMLTIDPYKAAPFIFASMPKSSGDVQFHTLNFFSGE